MKKNRLNSKQLAILPIFMALVALGCDSVILSGKAQEQVQTKPPAMKCSDYDHDQAACNDQIGVCEFYNSKCLSIADAKAQRDTAAAAIGDSLEGIKKKKLSAEAALNKVDPHNKGEKEKAQANLDLLTSSEKIIKILQSALKTDLNLTISEDFEHANNKLNELAPLANTADKSIAALKPYVTEENEKENLAYLENVIKATKESITQLDKTIKGLQTISLKNEPLLTKAINNVTNGLNALTAKINTEMATLPNEAGIALTTKTAINGIEGSIQNATASLDTYQKQIKDAKFSDKETNLLLNNVYDVQKNIIVAGNTRLTEIMATYAAEKAKEAASLGVSEQEKQKFVNKVAGVSNKLSSPHNASENIPEVLKLINDKASSSYSKKDWKNFFDTIINNNSDLEAFFQPFTLYSALNANEGELALKGNIKTIAAFYEKTVGRAEAIQKFPNAMLDVALEKINVGSERLKKYCTNIAKFNTGIDWPLEKDAQLDGYENDMENLYTYLNDFGFDTNAIIKTANMLIVSNNWAIQEKQYYDKIAKYQTSKQPIINKFPVSYLSMFTKTLMDHLYKDGTDNAQLIENLVKVKIPVYNNGSYSLDEFLAGLVNNPNFGKIEVSLRNALKNHSTKNIKDIANNDQDWNDDIENAKKIDISGKQRF